MRKQFFILFIFLFCLISQCLVFVPKDVSAVEIPEPYIYTYAPVNSFGATSFKEINISFYRSWINNTVIWSLQKSTNNVNWVDCSKLLLVKKDWNPVNLSVKFTLSWVSDESAYYQLLLKTDAVKSYQDKTSSNKMLLNYSITSSENYNIFFDWSDYKNSVEFSKTSFSKSIILVSGKNQFNWRVYTNAKMLKGEKMVIDPTFGATPTTSYYIFFNNHVTYLCGDYASPASDGIANNITIKLETMNVNINVICALYTYVDFSSTYASTLIATTEQKTLYSTDDNKIIVFNFSSPPDVVSGTNYYMALMPVNNPYGTTNRIKAVYNAGGGESMIYKNDYGSFDNPLTGESGDSFRSLYIYCSYTETGGGWSNTCPTNGAPSIANYSTGVDIDVGFWNVSISDIDANMTSGTINCSGIANMSWVSQANGTRSLTLPVLDYSTNYTVWLNYSDEFCDVNKTFWFITEDSPPPPWNNTCPNNGNPTVVNHSTNVIFNIGFWNVSISDIDGNTTSGTINCSNGNFTSWTNQVNGSRSLSLAYLSYSTNYTVWLNYSDEFCNVNKTFWFITESWPFTIYNNTIYVSDGYTLLGNSIDGWTLYLNYTGVSGSNFTGSILYLCNPNPANESYLDNKIIRNSLYNGLYTGIFVNSSNWTSNVTLCFYRSETINSSWISYGNLTINSSGFYSMFCSDMDAVETVYYWYVLAVRNGSILDNRSFMFTTGKTTTVIDYHHHSVPGFTGFEIVICVGMLIFLFWILRRKK